MRVEVDEDLCCGYAECKALAPDVFEIDADNRAIVKLARIPSVLVEQTELAINACPTRAIKAIVDE